MNNKYDEHRRRHYVDRVLQGWLLIGLITLEILLFGIGLYIIYQNMNAAIEMQIFQAHAANESGSTLLLSELMRVLPWILVVNIIAVLITNRVWARYITNIIYSLRQMLVAASKLDFKGVPDQSEYSHEVLEKGAVWMRRERERNQMLKAAIAELSVDSEPVEAQKVLDRVKNLLK